MKLIFITLIICVTSITVWAQADSITTENQEKTTLTLAALYGSNVSYYGQSTSQKLPYVLANATLRLPIGLYFSAGSYKLLNYGSGISETDLGIGFDYPFTTALNAGISYTRSFYPENSPLLQAANENNINGTLAYQWPWLKSSLSADFAFGLEKDVFLSLNHSRSIELGSLFDENDLIALEPAIELVAGTQHFLETYTERKNAKNKGKGNGNGKGNLTETIVIPATSFDLLTYNLSIPFSYSRANYLAEISYQFSILGDKAITETTRTQSFINLSFYYQF